MPAVSQAQQLAMAIAEHQPGKLFARNRGLLKLSHQQLHDFAATKRSRLPLRKKKLADHMTALRTAGKFSQRRR